MLLKVKTITVEQSREDVIPFKIGAYLAELSQTGIFSEQLKQEYGFHLKLLCNTS